MRRRLAIDTPSSSVSNCSSQVRSLSTPLARSSASPNRAFRRHDALDNLRLLLGVHGFDVADVRHLVIYVVGEHQNLLDAWSAVSSWFDNDVPPATLLGVNLLGYSDQLVEIDATVMKHPDS